MRILFIVKRLAGHADGVGDYTQRLATALSAWEHTVTIRSPEKLLAACRQERADVVVLQFSPFMYGRRGVCWQLVGRLAAARLFSRARVVVAFHELYNLWGRNLLTVGLSLVHRAQFCAVGALAHEVVFTTPSRTELGRRWFFWKPRHVHCVPVGSNIPCVPLLPAIRQILADRFRAGARYLLCTFGLLQTGVCYEELLRAFAGLVHEDGVDTRLLLIGDWTGADPRRKQRLDELIASLRLSDRVQWSGPQAATGVSILLSISDLYLFYRTDGPTTRSGTLAAALEHGLPVLANRVPGLDPNFADGRTVRLFADVADLRHQCRELLTDPVQRTELGQRGREFYATALTWEQIAQQYTAIVGGARSSTLWEQRPRRSRVQSVRRIAAGTPLPRSPVEQSAP